MKLRMPNVPAPAVATQTVAAKDVGVLRTTPASDAPAAAPVASLQDQLQKKLRGSGFTKRVTQKLRTDYDDMQADLSTVPDPDALASTLPDGLADPGIILDESQQEAVDELCQQKYGCLIGPAGSGKTTTEKALLEKLGITEGEFTVPANTLHGSSDASKAFKASARLAICAFTGKAVQQSKRALPAYLHPYCDTAHGWLGYAPELIERYDEKTGSYNQVKVFQPTFTRYNKLRNLEYLIVDEAGMMPIYLWNQLMDALPSHCRVYAIGDINQLPPVHGHSILGFAMLKWPTFELRKIHRTEEGSIIDNAHRILTGQRINADGVTTHKMMLDGSQQKAKLQICALLQSFYKQGKFDPMQDVCITPQNVGGLGQETLNEMLVDVFNPVRYNEHNLPINPRVPIRTARGLSFHSVGDKVMLLKNKRDLGLTNGQVGIVTAITRNGNYKGEVIDEISFGGSSDAEEITFDMDDINSIDLGAVMSANDEATPADEDDINSRAASHIMTVKFQGIEDPLELSSTGDFSGIGLAYAMTCHKMQGSEARKVVIVLHSGVNLRMLTREWYYTALTRAQEKVVLLYTQRAEIHAVRAQAIRGETIEEKARAFIAATDDSSRLQPILHDSERW